MIYQTTSYSELPEFYGANPLTVNSFPINVTSTANKIIRIEGIRDVSLYSGGTYIFKVQTANNESIVNILATGLNIVSYDSSSVTPNSQKFTKRSDNIYYWAFGVSATNDTHFYLELRLVGKLNTSANLIFSICQSPNGGDAAIIPKVGITIEE